MKRVWLCCCVVLAGACNKAQEPAAKSAALKAEASVPNKQDAKAAAGREIPVTTSVPAAREAFLKGREAVDNVRIAQARPHFEEAVRLDPKFALAHAYLSVGQPKAKALELLAKAVRLAVGHDAAERAWIELYQAQRQGDAPKARALRQRLAELAPGDWRVALQLGTQAMFIDRDRKAAISHLRRATELSPSSGEPYNMLGYAHANAGEYDAALAAIRRYAELKPGEANAQDSLGEILAMAGKLEESAAAFERAAGLNAKNWIAWEGAAMAHGLRGNFDAARTALARAREAATALKDKLWLDVDVAKTYEAEGKVDEGMKALDAMEQTAVAKGEKVRALWAPIHRALLLMSAGKHDAARAHIDEAFKRGAKKDVDLDQLEDLEARGNLMRLVVAAHTKAAGDTAAPLAVLEAIAKERAQEPFRQSTVSHARGLSALASGDPKAALAHFARCAEEDFWCHSSAIVAAGRAGDAPAAASARARLEKRFARTMTFVATRARLKK